MKDFLQMLEDAFPTLKGHPRWMLAAFLALVLLAVLYGAKKRRRRICSDLSRTIWHQIFLTSRWLYVHQDSQNISDWKYYTSEVTGTGNAGDDIIWKLVSWPSLRPKDAFRMHGAVGMVNSIQESQTKLRARWKIEHDPDSFPVGRVPALGLKSKLRRASARVLGLIGSL